MLTMCEAGWRVQAFTTSLREGLYPHWKITGQQDNSSAHSHFSC